jgi:hypothetical protein
MKRKVLLCATGCEPTRCMSLDISPGQGRNLRAYLSFHRGEILPMGPLPWDYAVVYTQMYGVRLTMCISLSHSGDCPEHAMYR